MKPQLLVLLFLATLGATSAFDEILPVESNIWDNNQRLIASHEDPFEESFEEFDLNLKDLVIRKREVSNDEALEGSGDDTPTDETQPKSGQQNSTTTLPTTVAVNATSHSAGATSTNVEATTVAPTDPEVTTTVASTAKSSPAVETTVSVENTTAVSKFAVQKLHIEETPKEIEAAKPVESDKKVGSEKENAPEFQPPIQKEEIDKEQSGIAILATNADTATLEGSERTLERMKPNENLKSAVAEEPVPGESRPEGGKRDTKIIIFMLAGVVVVGAAAVTFNYIRKKNQGENEESAVDRLNGDCAKSDNPEVGRELKPLMKNGEGEIRPPVTVEYKDEKAEAK